MLNPPPGYANNAGQYAIVSAPPDADSKYVSQGYPPNTVPKAPARWYEVFDIGVESRTGSNQASYSSPLTAGSVQRIHTDSPPDYWVISILVNTANAQLNIWTDGDPVGYPVRLGNGGYCCIPSRGKPYLTLRANAQSVVGTVIAVGGYMNQEVMINGGTAA